MPTSNKRAKKLKKLFSRPSFDMKSKKKTKKNRIQYSSIINKPIEQISAAYRKIYINYYVKIKIIISDVISLKVQVVN